MDISELQFGPELKVQYQKENDPQYELLKEGSYRCICTGLELVKLKTDKIPWALKLVFVPLAHTFTHAHYMLLPAKASIDVFWQAVTDRTELTFENFLLLKGNELLSTIRYLMKDTFWIVDIVHREASTKPTHDEDVITFPYVIRFRWEE